MLVSKKLGGVQTSGTFLCERRAWKIWYSLYVAYNLGRAVVGGEK